MPSPPRRHLLHRLVSRGDVVAVRDLLARRPSVEVDLEGLDDQRLTPLMHACRSPEAPVEMVRLLLEAGASVHVSQSGEAFDRGATALSLALSSGDVGKTQVLLDAGADPHYCREGVHAAMVDLAVGPGARGDSRVPELVGLLLSHGVAARGSSDEQRSAVLVMADVGRYDALRVLLDAGCDEAPLAWSPLIRAVALGTVADIEASVRGGSALEAVDFGQRTAWLVAVQGGDVRKALTLRDLGADIRACATLGRAALTLAIDCHRLDMLRWLIGIGFDPEGIDGFEDTPIFRAVAADDADAVRLLLSAGAQPDRGVNDEFPIQRVRSRAVALLLLDAGADPARLSDEGRRTLVGLPIDPDPLALAEVDSGEFCAARARRFGSSNPERMREPFLVAMIRAGVSAHHASRYYDGPEWEPGGRPTWSAQRFGQSVTLLPDGRAVQIGGEHEDHYDLDFCIYNDVFVHHLDGTIDVLGYPPHVFPPTDFHTATLLHGFIYVIGSLGYPKGRRPGHTPVHRLDLSTWAMEPVDAGGIGPGWIHRHRATLVSGHEIRVSGGIVVDAQGGPSVEHTGEYVLDVRVPEWRVVAG